MTSIATPTALTHESLQRAVLELSERHPDLARIVALHGVPPLWERPPGFVTLARIILEQQVSLASAASLFSRLDREMAGGFSPVSILAEGPTGLQRLGLTRQKASYLHTLADLVSSGSLPLEDLAHSSDEEAAHILMRVPGIGPWSASIYLLMALLRPDVWPSGDLALHRVVEQLTQQSKMSREAVDAVAQSWRPWRAVAARILWQGYLGGLTGVPGSR